jgi:hypothetical protein
MSTHPLPVGTVVRHYGQQFPAAREGTATITAVKGPYRDGSYEYEVETGRDFSRMPGPGNPPERRWWSSFATIPAEGAPR